MRAITLAQIVPVYSTKVATEWVYSHCVQPGNEPIRQGKGVVFGFAPLLSPLLRRPRPQRPQRCSHLSRNANRGATTDIPKHGPGSACGALCVVAARTAVRASRHTVPLFDKGSVWSNSPTHYALDSMNAFPHSIQ